MRTLRQKLQAVFCPDTRQVFSAALGVIISEVGLEDVTRELENMVCDGLPDVAHFAATHLHLKDVESHARSVLLSNQSRYASYIKRAGIKI